MTSIYVKLIAGLVAVIVLFGGGVWAYNAILEQGRAEGIAETTVKWKAQVDDMNAAAVRQATKNAAELAASEKRNQEQHDGYEEQLAAAAADRAKFAGKLSDAVAAIAAIRADNAARVQSGSGTTQASGPSADELTGRLLERIEGAQSECVLNADRLDHLVAEVAPQANAPDTPP